MPRPESRAREHRHRSESASPAYRDLDGVTRLVEIGGRTANTGEPETSHPAPEPHVGRSPRELTAMSRFKDASDLWLSKIDAMVVDGRRSPGTVDTYRRQLKKHVLPAHGEVSSGRRRRRWSTR